MDKIRKEVEGVRKELIALSEYILDNPELGNQELKACRAHVDLLKEHGFAVEEGYLGIETAFRAEYASGKPGPRIAYMAEYDALPEIGHGCGHNILGATSTGAGIVLSRLLSDLGGSVVVLGTPAEETRGAKVTFAEKGAFDDCDVAMAAHPGDKHYKSGQSLAMEAIQFTFRGKTAHAAASPHKGINALDAAIQTFNAINALREHIQTDARIHGIIKDGGEAANIVPDLAVAQFYVRAATKTYLNELVEKVKNCATGASLAAGTRIEISNYEYSYDNLVTNQALSNLYARKLALAGVEEILEAPYDYGSTDVGNVSHVCPTIHPYFAISTDPIVAHTVEFRDATREPYAYENMEKTIAALAATGVEIIQDQDLLDQIKGEFAQSRR
jgi:amidohydrolase